MQLVKLSSTLILASALFTSLLPISSVRAEDQNALFGKLADKIQCSTADVGLGNNTQNDIQRNSSSRQASSNNSNSAWGNSSNSNSSKKTHNDGGGGSVSVFGLFSVGGNGGSQGSSENSSKNSSSYGRNNNASNSSKSSNSNFNDRSSSTVVVGQVKDCDSNNAAAASVITTLDTNRTAKDIANINADVSKYGIDAQVKINNDNNKTAVDLFNAQRRSGQVNNLIQWYTPQR